MALFTKKNYFNLCQKDKRARRGKFQSSKLSSFSPVLMFFLMPPHVYTNFRGPPSWLWRKCNRLLGLGRPWGAVTLSRWYEGWYIGRWGARRGLKSRSTNYPDNGHHGDPPPTRKIPMVEPGIEPGTTWLVVRSSDHQITRLDLDQWRGDRQGVPKRRWQTNLLLHPKPQKGEDLHYIFWCAVSPKHDLDLGYTKAVALSVTWLISVNKVTQHFPLQHLRSVQLQQSRDGPQAHGEQWLQRDETPLIWVERSVLALRRV